MLKGAAQTSSGYGTWRQEPNSPRLQTIHMVSRVWHFHRTERSWPQVLLIARSGYGTWRHQRQIGAPLHYENSVTSVAFSPDGKTLVSSAFNGKVAFWDVGKRAFKDQFLVRSVNLLRYASFTLDGRRVVTVSQDGDIKIWEVGSGCESIQTHRETSRQQWRSTAWCWCNIFPGRHNFCHIIRQRL